MTSRQEIENLNDIISKLQDIISMITIMECKAILQRCVQDLEGKIAIDLEIDALTQKREALMATIVKLRMDAWKLDMGYIAA